MGYTLSIRSIIQAQLKSLVFQTMRVYQLNSKSNRTMNDERANIKYVVNSKWMSVVFGGSGGGDGGVGKIK